VEYKLQLLDPTPERFLRLVTQLKWRLLEGGGQAYYELGVADSGALIGIEKSKMEKTLGTLEAMAGEIGASVVVVREIEIPATWSDAAKLLESSAGVQSGAGTPEVQDMLARFKRAGGGQSKPRTRPTAWGALEVLRPGASGLTSESEDISGGSDVDTPSPTSASASPSPSPAAQPTALPSVSDEMFAFDLEISSVYKPVLPLHNPNGAPRSWEENQHNGTHFTKKGTKSKSGSPSGSKTNGKKSDSPPKGADDKKALKRQKRDEGRERRKLATVTVRPVGVSPTSDDQVAQDLEATVHALEKLRVPLDDDRSMPVNISIEPPETASEKRVIVEALVVRKLSTEEAFLDFGGFDLGD
jgi:hypothetical protein